MIEVRTVPLAPIFYVGRRICPVCGTDFPYTSEWTLRINSELYCSYKCKRVVEKQFESGERKIVHRRITEEEKAAILEYCAQNPDASIGTVSKHFDRSYDTMRVFLHKNGINPPRQVADHPDYYSNLQAITEARERGETWKQIAEKYGYDHRYVRDWFNGIGKERIR